MKKLFSNKKRNFLFIAISLISFIIIACNEEEKTDLGNYNAIVIGKSPLKTCTPDNNVFVIKLLPEKIKNIPANTNDNFFYEINLPTKFQKYNYPINVTFRTPTQAELNSVSSDCITGAPLSYIYIESANDNW